MIGYRSSLRFLLRLGGTALCLAFVAIFLPARTMASIHSAVGLGDFPASAITDYLSRSVAALYGFHGVLLWIISTDLRRFAPLVAYAGIMNVVFGTMLTAIDLHAGMPVWWTMGEGPPVVVIGALILFLLRRSGLDEAGQERAL